MDAEILSFKGMSAKRSNLIFSFPFGSNVRRSAAAGAKKPALYLLILTGASGFEGSDTT